MYIRSNIYTLVPWQGSCYFKHMKLRTKNKYISQVETLYCMGLLGMYTASKSCA